MQVNIIYILMHDSIMKSISNVKCPLCGFINVVQIFETQWPQSYECNGCKEFFAGHQNPHGWPWILCTYGDVPWFGIQQKEKLK